MGQGAGHVADKLLHELEPRHSNLLGIGYNVPCDTKAELGPQSLYSYMD